MVLTQSDIERYKRQIPIDGFGLEAQMRLKESVVLVAGVGGIGGTAALYLSTAGIGKLILIHDGELVLPDLNRQIMMSHDGIGQDRVYQAKDAIHRINPDVSIEVLPDKVSEENLDIILPQADVVIDCRHNFKERDILNEACVRHRKILVEAAMNDMEAYITTIIPYRTPCLSCIYPEKPEWDYLGFNVLGAVSGTIGCLSAIEAIKVLTGLGEPLYSKLLFFDTKGMEFKKFNLYRRSDCGVCGYDNPC
ncbi:MAG: HesA/MoeB/ThiF family protein [Nitrospinae bacterium]|nr:HesA/MoeB/ThiF family protein [Nitrospinota bacterium]